MGSRIHISRWWNVGSRFCKHVIKHPDELPFVWTVFSCVCMSKIFIEYDIISHKIWASRKRNGCLKSPVRTQCVWKDSFEVCARNLSKFRVVWITLSLHLHLGFGVCAPSLGLRRRLRFPLPRYDTPTPLACPKVGGVGLGVQSLRFEVWGWGLELRAWGFGSRFRV